MKLLDKNRQEFEYIFMYINKQIQSDGIWDISIHNKFIFIRLYSELCSVKIKKKKQFKKSYSKAIW